jgi:hypothetical protein
MLLWLHWYNDSEFPGTYYLLFGSRPALPINRFVGDKTAAFANTEIQLIHQHYKVFLSREPSLATFFPSVPSSVENQHVKLILPYILYA